MTFNHNLVEVREMEATTLESGRIYHTPDGPVSSITTILSSTADKAWLEEWKTSLGEEAAAAETLRCSDRGTAVHEMSEFYLKNRKNITDHHSPENIKRFNQIKMYLNKINNILGIEIPLYTKLLRIAGRCDVIGEYDGKLSIIDFKTSNGNKTSGIIEDYFLQCTAYSIMFEEMYGIQIDQIVVIISVERGICGQVFKRDRADYIKPLIKRVKQFYEQP